MSQEFIDLEIADGKPTIPVSEEVDPREWSVNLKTKTLHHQPPLPSPNIPPFVFPEGITPVDPSTLPANEKPPY